MKKYWDEAISYLEYKEVGADRILNPKSEEEKEFKHYYELGIQRMARMETKFKPSDEDLETLKSKNFTGKILIISEVWCGDASQAIPVIEEFFKGKNEVKIFLRDNNQELINQFLTDGAQSIPKVLILDEDYNVINTWGPRTAHGTELLKEFKANPETYAREEFYNDLQVYYSRNKGKDTITEILNLI